MSLGIHSEKKDPAGPGLTVDESEIDPPPPFDATSSSASSFVAPPDYGDVPLGINKAYVNPEQSSVVLRFQKAWSLGKWRVEDRNGGELMHVDGKFWSAHRVRTFLTPNEDPIYNFRQGPLVKACWFLDNPSAPEGKHLLDMSASCNPYARVVVDAEFKNVVGDGKPVRLQARQEKERATLKHSGLPHKFGVYWGDSCVARIERCSMPFTKCMKFSAHYYTITMAPQIDYSLMVSIAVAIDDRLWAKSSAYGGIASASAGSVSAGVAAAGGGA